MARERLENRRSSETISIQYGNMHLHVSYGRFGPGPREGQLAEIFFSGAKTGSDVRLQLTEAITAASFALQYGATPEELLRALPQDGNEPEGALGLILQAWIAMAQPRTQA